MILLNHKAKNKSIVMRPQWPSHLSLFPLDNLYFFKNKFIGPQEVSNMTQFHCPQVSYYSLGVSLM